MPAKRMGVDPCLYPPFDTRKSGYAGFRPQQVFTEIISEMDIHSTVMWSLYLKLQIARLPLIGST